MDWSRFVYYYLFCLLTPRTLGLMCYTCVSTVNDLRCLNDPESVPNGSPVTDCQKGDLGCCTITRQEYLEEPGKIVSFARLCQENCKNLGFFDQPDATSRFYNTYCKTPKCNIGPGNKSLSSIDNDGNGNNNIWNIPGSTGTSLNVSAYIMVLVTLLAMVILRME